MSVFCSSSPTSRAISKVAPVQACSLMWSLDLKNWNRPHSRRQSRRSAQLQTVASRNELERWFFMSLAEAGYCQKHKPQIQQPPLFFTSQRPAVMMKRRRVHDISFWRQHHTNALASDEEAPVEPNRTREELMALVDQYNGESITDQLPLLELPKLYQPGDGPYLSVSDKQEDEWPPPYAAWPATPETKDKIVVLNEALRDFSKDPKDIYQLYRDLPEPRVPYLESKTRHRLLRHLSTVEKKDELSMLRYFSVVDDMRGTAIPLSVTEWTSAISFAARYVSRSTEIEVEAALQMWREMEHIAGVKSTSATFNVLFDVACKAGKFTLAEMIYKEMVNRGLEYSRYHHVSLIYYNGLKGDGDGARAAYKSMVEAGDIVDTVVLNAMISALLNSGEPHAAENVYERMKKIHIEGSGGRPLPARDYKAQRTITATLRKMAIIVKQDPTRRDKLQKKAAIAPDVHTYRLLLNYFAVRAGELDKSARFLDEMKLFEIPLHGALFLTLLKGFALHGGIRYTHWSDRRLENVWDAFLEALDNEVADLYVSKWMILWALRAFAKCSGKSRAIAAWEEIRQRWDPGEADLDFIMQELRYLLEDQDMAEKRNDWLLGPL